MTKTGVVGAAGTLKGLSIEATGYAHLASQLEMQGMPKSNTQENQRRIIFLG